MKTHNAKTIAAAVTIAAAAAATTTDPKTEFESMQSQDLASKMPKTEIMPSTPVSTVWTAIISDDDSEKLVSGPTPYPVKLQSNGNSQSGNYEALKTKPPAVAHVTATTELYSPGSKYVSSDAFDKQYLTIGECQRAYNKLRKTNIGPPPGYEKVAFYGRLNTNRMGMPLGGVTFDVTPPWINKDMQPQANISMEGAYGLAGLARNLEAAQQNRQPLSQFFGHETARLNLNANCLSNQVHAGFAGPLQGGRCAPHEINCNVPQCYRLTEGKELTQPKIDEMEVELLFFFFYSYPGDMMQMLAAAELAERGWRYHIYERLWLRRQPDNPHYVRNGHRESGEYNYFNMVHWQIMARHFDIMPEELEHTITKTELREKYGYHPQMCDRLF